MSKQSLIVWLWLLGYLLSLDYLSDHWDTFFAGL